MLWDVKLSVYYCSLQLCAGERISTKEGEERRKGGTFLYKRL